MSYPKKAKNLADALRRVYQGPKAAERLAFDTGYRLSAAKMALEGRYPRAWEKLLRLIEKRPNLLAHALQTTWAEELSIRAEINETRSRIQELERRIEKNKALDREDT